MRHWLSRGTSSQEDNSSVQTEPEPAAGVTGRPQSSQEPNAAAMPQITSQRPEMERSVKRWPQLAESEWMLVCLCAFFGWK